jgi:uncharacterized membrane protein (UPF0127 family)
MKFVKVLDARGEPLLARAKWCPSFMSRLRGLTFRRSLAPDEGLILAERRASVVATSIHMFFVNFAIAAVWLDDERRVVHKTLARPWRPFYASPRPARYVLEGPPALLERIAVGDILSFKETSG